MDEATRLQVTAAAPGRSTWLSANAGSGKTRVLTDRVARLLLGGVEPQNILCLTYTKAAASEMQNRLFKRLGAWAMMPIEALRGELAVLGVGDLEAPETLPEARRLFARAIETPGGLRIQTIHSYCASLLRRFPLEAEVTPDFSEMDDRSASLLRDQVIEDIAERQPEALDALAVHLSGDNLAPLVQEILHQRDAFARPVTDAEVKSWFGLGPHDDLTGIVGEAFLGTEQGFMPSVVRQMGESDKPTDQRVANRLSEVDWTAPSAADLDLLCGVLLTGAGAKEPFSAKIGSIPTKACQAAMGAELDELNALMRRIEQVRERRNSLYAAQKTSALHAFAQVFLPAYEAEKLRRGWLDFDDLILKTRDLLSRPEVAQWVLYRLDGGLDHILVDEAQDTSPAQWQVIKELAQELTAGLGARDETERTLFVVGDKKQSIYSFQGADPAKFDEMRGQFEARLAGSAIPLETLEMKHSFRSSRAILGFVDQTVRIDEISHRAFWSDLPGRVDIWPSVPAAEARENHNWFDPVDIVADSNHNVRLAEEIAGFIKSIIGKETIPQAKGTRRTVRAADILILVRRRGALFEALIRACKAADLPVAGADRLKLGAELAVKDLVALMRFLATPEDDLSFAAALKSPLFGWSEQELYDLAAGRGEVFLWQAFRQRKEAYPESFAVLDDLRRQADFLRPYDLIERMLVRHDGRRKLLARLGTEAVDGIDALLTQALAYERTEVPSLTRFLTYLDTEDVEIKRQLDSAGDLIRIMTVHGAKGLEAPIVILPQTAKLRQRHGDQVYLLDQDKPVWRMPADQQPAQITAAIEAKRSSQSAEDERLLYVAATRAETWLIVAAAGDVGAGDDTWYSKAEEGARSLGAQPLETPTGMGLRYEHGDWSGPPLVLDPDPPKSTLAPPAWVWERAPNPIKEIEVRAPSDLGGAKALPGPGGQSEAEALLFGNMVHALLELGPECLLQRRGADVLARLFPGVAPDAAIDAARRVFDAPHLAALFGAGALSEVSLSADVPGLGRLSGTIDKLLITPGKVTAIDFKTNAVEPRAPDEVPDGLLRQMGAYLAMLEPLYPEREIALALLWTGSARLMPLPHEIVRRALEDAATS